MCVFERERGGGFVCVGVCVCVYVCMCVSECGFVCVCVYARLCLWCARSRISVNARAAFPRIQARVF